MMRNFQYSLLKLGRVHEIEKEFNNVGISEIEIGDYISNYPVEYTNVACEGWLDAIIGVAEIYPSDEFTGWRVLSKEIDEDGKEYLRLISAGVPLKYETFYTEGDHTAEIYNDFTIGFLETEIGIGSGKFNAHGFDVENITNLQTIFKNTITSNVRALIKEDIEELLGKTFEDKIDLTNEDYANLLLIPGKDEYSNKFVPLHLGTRFHEGSAWTWYIDSSGNMDGLYSSDSFGVRPVVTLVPELDFAPSASKINNTNTWEILF